MKTPDPKGATGARATGDLRTSLGTLCDGLPDFGSVVSA